VISFYFLTNKILALEIKHIDKNLVRKLKAGDQASYRVIFDVYSEKLFHFAYSYLKDADDSEEIVQEVFLRLWEIRSEIDEEKSLKSFLYKMTVNKVLNHLKHKIVRQKYESYLTNHAPFLSETPEEQMCWQELNEKIKELVILLPEQKRKVFIMSKLKGFSNAEISAALGLSIRTVENQLYRATKFIKERIDGDYLSLLVFCVGVLLQEL